MATIPNDKEKYQRHLEQMMQNAINSMDIVKHFRKAVAAAFEEGFKFGQEELLNHAKRIVEVEERERVDGVLLGDSKDDIPF